MNVSGRMLSEIVGVSADTIYNSLTVFNSFIRGFGDYYSTLVAIGKR